jgi:hypothetical protein
VHVMNFALPDNVIVRNRCALSEKCLSCIFEVEFRVGRGGVRCFSW